MNPDRSPEVRLPDRAVAWAHRRGAAFEGCQGYQPKRTPQVHRGTRAWMRTVVPLQRTCIGLWVVLPGLGVH